MSLNLNHNFNNRPTPTIKVKESSVSGVQAQPIITYAQSPNPTPQQTTYIIQQPTASNGPQAPVVYENPPQSLREEYYQELYIVKIPVKDTTTTTDCDPCDPCKKKKPNKSTAYNLLYTDSRRESLYGANVIGDKLKFAFDFGREKVNHVMVKLDYFLDNELVVLTDEVSRSVYNADVFFEGVESDDGQAHLRVTYEKDECHRECHRCRRC